MINIDWGLLQLQYELFSVSTEELAEEYDTTPRMIEYVAEERGWKRQPLAVACQDYSQISDTSKITDKLLDEVQRKMLVMRSLKRSALGPRYISLETAILGACINMLKNLQTDDPTNAAALKQIAEVFRSLVEMTHGKGGSDANNETKGMQITILNKVETSKDSKEEVTVAIDGRKVASGV